MEFTKIKDLHSKEGQIVSINAWVQEIKGQSKIKFMQLRDITGVVQCVVLEPTLFEKIDKLTSESVINISGMVKKANVKSEEITEKSIEVEVSNLEIISIADSLPILVVEKDKTIITELSKRLDYRFLDLHKRKVQAIFKVQSTIMTGFREFMIKDGSLEVVFPSLIGASSEGGTDVFKVKYFEDEAYLSQSCQLYKQMLACSMEKVFSIFTCWRAEKHNTLRHLNECRQMDFEMAFADDKIVMDLMGKVVQYIVDKVLKENKTELDLLGVSLKVPSVKYLTFSETAELLKKEGVEVGEDDLTGECEEKLGELFPDTIIFVHDWPIAGKPFYIMPKDEKANAILSKGFDAIYKGMEITSGGQRIHLPELLIERLKAKGLNPEEFKEYVDSFRYGAPPHAGWAIGVERLTMLILGIKNIREVTLFPRDRDRLTP
ncbi:MAG: aspartate--tRNA(Asn) ligase [Candidatus Nanoarchaeia archaeon]|nr:aspartate--tRNA(Asn) ligase [Candidatus Nanoarchaeia archaeon]